MTRNTPTTGLSSLLSQFYHICVAFHCFANGYVIGCYRVENHFWIQKCNWWILGQCYGQIFLSSFVLLHSYTNWLLWRNRILSQTSNRLERTETEKTCRTTLNVSRLFLSYLHVPYRLVYGSYILVLGSEISHLISNYWRLCKFLYRMQHRSSHWSNTNRKTTVALPTLGTSCDIHCLFYIFFLLWQISMVGSLCWMLWNYKHIFSTSFCMQRILSWMARTNVVPMELSSSLDNLCDP